MSQTVLWMAVALGGFGILLFAVCLVAERYIAEIRGILGERQVRRVISGLGYPAIHSFYAVDSSGIHTQIDHLVKVPAGIVVIETKNFLGSLYGQAHEKSWRHVNGGFRRTIQNPLRQNYRHVATLRERYPDVDLLNLVCFTSGRFPRGIPSGITTKSNLTEILTALHSAAVISPPELDLAWADLERMASAQTSSDRRAHLRNLKERFARQRY